MPITLAQIRSLVEEELSRLADAHVVAPIRSLLVEPAVVWREWDYGEPGLSFACWSVLNHAASNSGIAYCESGFGPRSPWGLVTLSGEYMSIGMDCAWYPSLPH